MSVQISPSILSADFANLENELCRIAGADMVHVDVMDGHFVPNLTIGLPVVERLAAVSPLPLDVHLMVEDADTWAPRYAAAGAASVTFHLEATRAPFVLAGRLHEMGVRAAAALRPATPVEAVEALLGVLDMVLVMTVEPGFGGQQLIEPTIDKVRHVRGLAETRGLELDVEVDGGVSRTTIAQIAAAGANVFVAGSAVFGSRDPAAEIAALRKIAQRAALVF